MRRFNPNALPARIIDVLETEGGWVTLAELYERLPAPKDSIRRACYRLKHRGVVESQIVEWGKRRTSKSSANGYMGNGGGNIPRILTEWRVAKPCTKCGVVKPLTEYHVHRNSDRMPSCKECKTIDQKVTVGGWRGPSGRLRLPKEPESF